METDKLTDVFNRLEERKKAGYIANLQKKAGNGHCCPVKISEQ